jgi:hypothetical protein
MAVINPGHSSYSVRFVNQPKLLPSSCCVMLRGVPFDPPVGRRTGFGPKHLYHDVRDPSVVELALSLSKGTLLQGDKFGFFMSR